MKRQRFFQWLLMPAVAVGLSLSLAACSDDDDTDGAAVDESKEQVMAAGVSDDATVLASLLREWCGYDADEATSALLGQTFTPTVGEAADASQPLTRTVVVGTQAEADAIAVRMLDVLGISRQQPAGFAWQNSAIGTVQYAHGTGNELGVMTIAVRQVPQLTKLLFVAQGGENAAGDPYYKKGDIVKYKDRYWICMSNHRKDAEATWLSFDCGEQVNDLTAKTCHWMTVGYDHYYSGDMASPETLADWLTNYVLSKAGYEQVISHIGTLPHKVINQIVPSTEALRLNLMERLTTTATKLPLDLNEDATAEGQLLAAREYAVTAEQANGNKTTRTLNPLGLLLAGPMRWSMGLTYDYWVPNLVMVKDEDGIELKNYLNDAASQTTQKSHFLWDMYATDIDVDGDDERVATGKYDVICVGTHWTHKAFVENGVTTYNLMNFVSHKRKLEGRQVNLEDPDDLDWTLRNITSRELHIKDKGVANTAFEAVYSWHDDAAYALQPGWILASDGNFYKTETAVLQAGKTPCAVVLYYNPDKEVEANTGYHGLAMGVEDLVVIGESNFPFDGGLEQNVMSWGECVASYNEDDLAGVLDGLAMTEKLAAGCQQGHQHPAFSELDNYDVRVPEGVQFDLSRWFIPSAGQWILAMEGQGITWDPVNHEFSTDEYDWELPQAGYAFHANNGFWTSTGAADSQGENAYYFRLSISFSHFGKRRTIGVRPMIAFKAK